MTNPFALQLGILPLINRLFEELELKELLESHIGKLGPHVKVSSSNLVVAVIANLLNCSAESLYATSEFFSKRPVKSILGCNPEDINRHVLGRLLDKIYIFGGVKLFMEVAAHICKKLNHKVEIAHADSTSFHYHGESHTEEGAVLITQGYSRDAHPELKQVCSFMMVDSKLGLPIAFTAFDGNKSDKALFPEFIQAHKLTLGSYFHDLKYVVQDSAGITETNLNTLNEAGLYLVSCLPNTYNATKETYTIDRGLFSAIYPDEEDGPEGYFLPESVEINGVKMKALTIYNPKMESKKTKTATKKANKQLEAAQKELISVYKTIFDSKEEASKKVQSIIARKKLIKLDSIAFEDVIIKKPGRPRKDGSSQTTKYKVKAILSVNPEALATEIDMQVRHTIVTTDIEHEWTAQELFETYHNQQRVERGWRTMKSPRFFADSIFLESPSRIESFLWLMTLALLVLTLLTHLIQKAMHAKKLTIPSPSGEKAMGKPSAQRLTQYIHHMNVTLVSPSAERLMVLNLEPPFRKILAALGDEWLTDYLAERYRPELRASL